MNYTYDDLLTIIEDKFGFTRKHVSAHGRMADLFNQFGLPAGDTTDNLDILCQRCGVVPASRLYGDALSAIASGGYTRSELSGGVVRCAPVEGYPLDVISQISAVQSGTGDPSPDNIRPISGWNAARLEHFRRNLLDVGLFDGMAVNGFSVKADRDTGTIAVTALRDASNITFASIKIPLKAGQAYVFSASLDGAPNGLVNCDVLDEASGLRVSVIDMGQTFTVQSGRVYLLKFYNNKAGASVSAGEQKVYARCGLYLANGDDTFEPYAGASYAAELPETVFGGELDWGTGELIKTHQTFVFNGSENWTRKIHSTSGITMYSLNIGAGLSAVKPEKAMWLCDRLVPVDYNYAQTSKPEYSISFMSSASDVVIVLEHNSALSIDEFKAWLAENPVTLTYELKTPITIQLTPQQIRAIAGVNTLYTYSGDTSVTGVAISE